jgi:hypothetical protein
MADQTVVLTPGTNPTGGFEWQMSLNGGNAQGAPYPSIKVAHGDSPTITFSIQNAPGVAFTDAPFLIPADANGIHIKSVQPTVLQVHDKNLAKGDVPYVLMFNNATKLDPIIDNDGGGHFAFNDFASSSASMLIGGAVIGAILVLVVRALFSKRG